MNGMIAVPQWLRNARPQTAMFCDMINDTLKDDPNISLAAFAKQIDQVNKENTLKLIQAREREQFEKSEDEIKVAEIIAQYKALENIFNQASARIKALSERIDKLCIDHKGEQEDENNGDE